MSRTIMGWLCSSLIFHFAAIALLRLSVSTRRTSEHSRSGDVILRPRVCSSSPLRPFHPSYHRPILAGLDRPCAHTPTRRKLKWLLREAWSNWEIPPALIRFTACLNGNWRLCTPIRYRLRFFFSLGQITMQIEGLQTILIASFPFAFS